MSVVAAIFTLNSLLDNSHKELVTEVTLGGLGVGVQNKCVRDLQSVGQVEVNPGRPAYNRGEAGGEGREERRGCV